jgi:DNA-directed RNA polymerase subunit RPC12/RpoP
MKKMSLKRTIKKGTQLRAMKYECLDCHKKFYSPASVTKRLSKNETVTEHVCPYCYSLNFKEINKVKR